jgi:lipopolysaccharide/colanic/teichoic acid biosynthesis glycosyltransferase
MRRRPQVVVGAGRLGRSGAADAASAGGLPTIARILKRIFDIVLSASGLVVLAPVLTIIAWRIRTGSSGPALYRQMRGGEKGTTFCIYKFRTMVVDADERLQDVLHLNVHSRIWSDPRLYKIPDDPRVTRFGARLRRHALDELPQLINVLKGEMSLVGPRPLMLIEDRHVVPGHLRSTVKPGITGPWQVGGRNELPFEEMMRLDALYVAQWSFWGDLCLLVRTIPEVLRPRGVY